MTRDAVAASAHGDRELGLACKPDSRNNVGDIERPDDQLRPAVEHPVERRARKFVTAVIPDDHRPAVLLAEVRDGPLQLNSHTTS